MNAPSHRYANFVSFRTRYDSANDTIALRLCGDMHSSTISTSIQQGYVNYTNQKSRCRLQRKQ
jgi:hypothetical protein